MVNGALWTFMAAMDARASRRVRTDGAALAGRRLWIERRALDGQVDDRAVLAAAGPVDVVEVGDLAPPSVHSFVSRIIFSSRKPKREYGSGAGIGDHG